MDGAGRFYNKTVVLFSKQVSVVKFIIGDHHSDHFNNSR